MKTQENPQDSRRPAALAPQAREGLIHRCLRHLLAPALRPLIQAEMEALRAEFEALLEVHVGHVPGHGPAEARAYLDDLEREEAEKRSAEQERRRRESFERSHRELQRRRAMREAMREAGDLRPEDLQ